MHESKHHKYVNSLLATGIGVFAALLPHTLRAQPQTVGEIIEVIARLVKFAIPVVALLALLTFFWGAGNFILGSNDEEKLKNGRILMLWGVIALFVMVSVWGILELFSSDVFGGTIGVPLLPE